MTDKRQLIEQMQQASAADERQLHTTTWLLKRLREMKSALQECETYFEERATAEWIEDGPSANREGQLLTEVRDALAGLKRGLTFATAQDGAVLARIMDEDQEKSE
jgi:hypothetical protein